MAFNARGLYLAKDLESTEPTTDRTIGENSAIATHGKKGKRPINRTGDQALRTRENAGDSNIEGDIVTRCHRPGCMRYIWISETDEHLAFHSESAQSHEEKEITNEMQTAGLGQMSKNIDPPRPGSSTVPNTSTRNATSAREDGPPVSTSCVQRASYPPETVPHAPDTQSATPPKTCLTCLDPIPPGKSYTLTCNHTWCQSCVRLKFRSSVTDLSLWPPKCCPATPFSMHVARRILGTSLVNELNERVEELNDKKRVYCCVPDCGAYIGAGNRDLLGDTAKCVKCGGVMCLLCKSAAHPGKGCRDDEETRKFLEVVEREGYRKCKGCGTMCELMEGCNHITCDTCGYQFCYLCGAENWRCGCPVISDGNLDRRINEARRLGLHGLANGYEHQRGQNNDGSNRADGELGPAGLPWGFIGW